MSLVVKMLKINLARNLNKSMKIQVSYNRATRIELKRLKSLSKLSTNKTLISLFVAIKKLKRNQIIILSNTKVKIKRVFLQLNLLNLSS